jgi:hypothetical protein
VIASRFLSLYKCVTAYGTVLFVILYFVAAQQYPGGSYHYRQAPGFSWRYNFWCNLLDGTALNGQPNIARPWAIAAMLLLVISLFVFWYKVPAMFSVANYLPRIIRWLGCSAMMLSGILLSTVSHDTAINVSCSLGGVAIVLLVWLLVVVKSYPLAIFGILCLILMSGNIYFYYIEPNLTVLALLQKVTFGAFLLWFVLIEARSNRPLQ